MLNSAARPRLGGGTIDLVNSDSELSPVGSFCNCRQLEHGPTLLVSVLPPAHIPR